jgi:hypothetical protein
MKHIEYLRSLDACHSAVNWSSDYPTLQKAWNECDRGDWMLWLLGKQAGKPDSKSRKKLVYVAVLCAKLALPYMKDERSKKALKIAEDYSQGKATLDEVRAAAADAAADAAAAAADAAAAAAAAAYAAAEAAAAAYAAAAAAYAAYAAADAAAAAAAAKTKVLKQSADIVREHYPKIRIK